MESIKYQTETHVALIDYEKVFDSLKHSFIWKTSRKYKSETVHKVNVQESKGENKGLLEKILWTKIVRIRNS